MQSKNLLSKAIGFFSILLFFLPIIVSSYSTYPFVFYKAIWLQVFTSFIFLCYLGILWKNWRQNRPFFSWLGLAVLMFYIVILVSSILGVNWARSLWSRPERMTGLFILFHYGILFLVWRSVFSKERWYKLWQWFAGLGALSVAAAAWQIVDPKFLFNLGGDRVVGTLGNPIYVAGFCLFTFFSSLVFFLKEKTRWRMAWFLEMVLSVVVLFATQTRGDLLGFWVGLVFLTISFLFLKQTRDSYKVQLLVILCGLIILPFLLFAGRNISWVRSFPGIGKFVSVPLEESTGGTRLIFWQMAIDGWKENPWLGWGWENYYDLSNKHYKPALLKYGHGEEWQDNAHNVVFNTLGTVGAIGLFTYLLIYTFAFGYLYKTFKRIELNEKKFTIILAAFLVAHFVRNLFVFEDLSSYLFLFWILAGIDILYQRQFNTRWTGKIQSIQEALKITGIWTKINSIFKNYFISLFIRFIGKFFKIILFVAIFIGVIFVQYRFAYIPVEADRLETKAVFTSLTDFKSGIEFHRQAIAGERTKYNPYKPDIAFDYAQFILTWESNHPDFAFSRYRSLANEMYVIGVKALLSYSSDYPTDPRAGHALGRAYIDGFDFWQNLTYLDMAVETYKKYLAISPNRQTLQFGLGRAYSLLGNHSEAIKVLQEAVKAEPAIAESHVMLASAYYAKGDYENAYIEFGEAIRIGYNFDTRELVKAFDVFNKKNNGSILEPLVRQHLSLSQPNARLLEFFIDYLNKTNRSAEAKIFKDKYVNL